MTIRSAEFVDALPTEEDRHERLVLLMEQYRELVALGIDQAKLTCPCGASFPIWRGARCPFCGVWLCEPCAARHFGGNSDSGPVLSAVGQRLRVLGEPLYVVDVQPFPETGEPAARLLVCMPTPDPVEVEA